MLKTHRDNGYSKTKKQKNIGVFFLHSQIKGTKAVTVTVPLYTSVNYLPPKGANSQIVSELIIDAFI